MAYTVVPIPEPVIAERLETCWGLETTRITELHLGTGGDTGTFRADAVYGHSFLKLAKTVSETGIAVSLFVEGSRDRRSRPHPALSRERLGDGSRLQDGRVPADRRLTYNY